MAPPTYLAPSTFMAAPTTFGLSPATYVGANWGAPVTAKVGVLFDFDGTLGDTETPAMEVAYWELAPFIHNVPAEKLEDEKVSFIQNNAGRAFEHMIENLDEARAKDGLPGVEEARQSDVNEAALRVINEARARFGLPGVQEASGSYPSLLVQQKEETVTALGKCAQPNPGVIDMLKELKSLGVPFNIATTSGKPRVPVCVDACEMREFFPTDDHIHSGESDFTPSRFKPDPDVYLKAAAAERLPPQWCIAVEDSASGVGSAANAKIGLIVGYVGASHIPVEKKQSHAEMLMQGTKAKDGRGAEIVISDMMDLPSIVKAFQVATANGTKITFPSDLQGSIYLPPSK
uniref:Riboflavin kinase n=1 Tax=Eutreptiella gymnastica TaxID=73025 RepID=A0A7S1I3K0_9EUGL